MPKLKAVDVEAGVAEPDDTSLVPAGDGTALATDVYLPARVGEKTSFPALLLRTPYGRRGSIDRVGELAPYFRELGVAVVAQDVRGRYDSPGCLTPFRNEVEDGNATVDWIAAQGWSNGAVLPIGDSYAGFTAWATAASGHPAVRGAVVRVTTPEIGEHWMYRQGAFRLQMNAQCAAFAWGGREAIDVEPDWSTRPLSKIDFDGADMSALDAWLEARSDEKAWLGLIGDAAGYWPKVRVPVLHWGGWWDLMSRGQISAWRRLASEGAPGQMLVMSGTDHSFNRFPPVAAARQVPLVDEYGVGADFIARVLDGSPPPSRTRWEVTHGEWHEDDRWPPESARGQRFFLSDAASALFGPEGGALSARPETISSTLTWAHDPADLVPSLETFVWGTLANGYPDERDVHVREDVVTFSGEPADEPLDIAGDIRLRLSLRASVDATQVVATLSDVRPDGTAWRVAEGALAVTGAAHQQSVDVDLGPLAYRLVPGHRLRVAISASSFPRYLWSCEDLVAGLRGTEPGAEHELSLRVGADSYLEVPVCA